MYPCINCVIYFEAFMNFILGSISAFYGIAGLIGDGSSTNISIIVIISGVLSVLAGLILLFGTYQTRDSHILIYLIISTPALFIETIKIGLEIITYDASLGALTLFVVIFMIVWAIQYSVWLFYNELVKLKNSEITPKTDDNVIFNKSDQDDAEQTKPKPTQEVTSESHKITTV